MKPWRRWFAFVLWSAVVLTAAPFANEIQAWIGKHLGRDALRVVLSLLLVAVVAGFVTWLLRRRDGTLIYRLVWILGLSTVTLALTWRLSVAAEPVHLALYAVLAVLVFRALEPRLRDGGVYPAAAVLTAIVGTLDEVVQWLLPSRFWDLADIGLNASAGVLVQLVIWKVVRPSQIAAGISAGSLRAVARLAAAETVLLLLCVSNTPARVEWLAETVPGLEYLNQTRRTYMNEYGHLYVDPEIGRFHSRLAEDDLHRFDRRHGASAGEVLDRFFEVGLRPVQEAHPPFREPFIYEAVGHLFYRTLFIREAGKQEDPEEEARLATAAYRENLILERYFSHSLAASNAALAAAERQRLEQLHRPQADFDSEASNWLVTRFSEAQARWFLLAVLAGLIVADRQAGGHVGPPLHSLRRPETR